MSKSLPEIEAITSPDGAIEQDMPCSRCGYNLRGLTLDGLCPECASPVSRSVHGNLLRFADPDWLNKLRLGMAFKLWGILIGIVIGGISGFSMNYGLPPIFSLLASVIGGGFRVWATFLITSPEPTIGIDEDPITLRKIIRSAAFVGFMGGQIQQTGQMTNTGLALILPGMLMSLLGLVSLFGEFVYLRRFARRIPDNKLESSTTSIMWGFGILMIVFLVIGIVAFIMVSRVMGAVLPGGAGGAPPGLTGSGGLFIGGFCFGGICMIVFGLWYLRLLTQYHKIFKSTAAEALNLSVPDSTTPIS